jgi:hypothetical protein
MMASAMFGMRQSHRSTSPSVLPQTIEFCQTENVFTPYAASHSITGLCVGEEARISKIIILFVVEQTTVLDSSPGQNDTWVTFRTRGILNTGFLLACSME